MFKKWLESNKNIEIQILAENSIEILYSLDHNETFLSDFQTLCSMLSEKIYSDTCRYTGSQGNIILLKYE